MTALGLPFLLGLTLGSALTLLLPVITRPHAPNSDGWTVAAITTRIERERSQQHSESPCGRTPIHTRPSSPHLASR
ncbi:hypothetical protein [Nocardia aurantiaca]|uniref:Uncharacterized protein n=1 Tax=Nocardia aurantiaca TaxID=2675850 RepID=A0A6I3KTP6_9NOCA|nr:hypothetical protein [Nocardia aurantiaca]MTE14173.1 hypothetical protein [Nocardia aurantiaca]